MKTTNRAMHAVYRQFTIVTWQKLDKKFVAIRHRWNWSRFDRAIVKYKLSPLYGPQPKCTRNSSGDEIANVNFPTHDIVHALQNTILVHKFRHRLAPLCVGTQVYQSQWNNAMQRPLRRSRSFKVTEFGTNRKLIYDFLLVINTNLPPILHRFRDIAFDRSITWRIYISGRGNYEIPPLSTEISRSRHAKQATDNGRKYET